MSAKTIPRSPKRFPTQIETQFRVYGSGAPWSVGKVVNLSETGLCLEANHEAGAGELLELVIDTVDKKGLRRKRIMCAKIIWLKDGRSGMEFVKKQRRA